MNSLWLSRGSGEPAAASDKAPAEALPAVPADKQPADPAPSGPPKRPQLQRNQLSQAPPPRAAPSAPAPPIPPISSFSSSDRSSSSSSSSSSNEPQAGGQPPSSGPSPLSSQPQTQQQQQQTQQQQQQQPSPQDSLSLAQLRRFVAEFPARTDVVAYDYVYEDTGPIGEEIDEWFMYNFWQWVRLNAANRAFHSAWARIFPAPSSTAAGGGGGGGGGRAVEEGEVEVAAWGDDDGGEEEEEGEGGIGGGGNKAEAKERRRSFVRSLLEGVKSSDRIARGEAIGALVYLVLGRWTETVKGASFISGLAEGKTKCAATEVQLNAMKEGVKLLAECGGIEVVWEALRGVFELFWADELPQNVQMAAEELINLMTIIYMAIQEALEHQAELAAVREKLLALNPSLVSFMLHVTAKLRWDETGVLPQPQIFLLFWKSILLVFGGSEEIAEAKKATSEYHDGDGKEITASPLDYHVFRQEITSKYPAYIPPQPLIPLESDQTSLLPRLPNHPVKNDGSNGILPGPPGQSGGASILHQPVHIATPAPSPPPSPGVGGKGGKKQNYQTNQNFPFMYPPLDATSNSAGGKGPAGLQDLLVGRKWEGSDVPASILEAGELFSKRVRMSRAIRQLWAEREEFLKFERGWDGVDDDLIDELDLSSLTLEEKEELGLAKPDCDDRPRKPSTPEVDYGPRGVDETVRRRLDAVEAFYKEALPHLQSLVIVLLKQVVAIANNVLSPTSANCPPGAGLPNARRNGVHGPNVLNGANGLPKGDASSPLDADVDEVRSREITAKAVTGILVLLLKWLKLSHVLKFEYMTQLLLDSNYIPMALKIFAINDIQQVVETKSDRLEHSFFYFCGSRAGIIPSPHAMPNPTATEFEEDISDDEDDAVPPPIKRRRSPVNDRGSEADTGAGSVPSASAAATPSDAPVRPEVDELGCPVNPLPEKPITDFSRRNFFSLINYLRILQKICKHKAHRNLLMMQYKSSNYLRKALKVPQPELRLYTLKIFKNQVPYCGRKWRQSNMRVITAIYLHCRPELRDEWLAGSDVDGVVEEAVPLEQALRSLTHWFNLRRYPDRVVGGAAAGDVAATRRALKEERDFFVRELEKADLSWLEMGGTGPGGGGGEGEGVEMGGSGMPGEVEWGWG
ncbi:hypothetical protein VTK26DRAFT_1152 [Humicola hyalothermophila]